MNRTRKWVQDVESGANNDEKVKVTFENDDNNPTCQPVERRRGAIETVNLDRELDPRRTDFNSRNE